MEQKIIAERHIRQYYEKIIEQVGRQIEAAKKAKATGKDVKEDIETIPAMDLADRTENIIGPKGVAKRYREVYTELKGDRIKTIFKLFKEIIEEKWCHIPDAQKRLEQAVKTSLVLLTEGVVVAPLDGVPSVRISKNLDGTKYVDIYFAGPIRAAGGTATVFPLILGDYAKTLLGLDRYKPTEDEVERYVEEVATYDEIVSRQYKLSAEEVRKIVRGCPVCINGEPTEDRMVTAFKDLERIPSNKVRGGMCLVISEGIGLKAMKTLSLAKSLGLDWSWLEGIIKISKGGEKGESIQPNYKYLTRIAAGRPIFSYPSKIGGFRLRYGRGRNTGIMGKAVHPATMHLLDEFIAVGTQLKVERPGKSAEVFPCDSIDGPIVKLVNGDVRQVNSYKEAIELSEKVKEILFLGDMLVSIGDFRKTAHPLMPAGYCPEWWLLDLDKAVKKQGKAPNIDLEKIRAAPNKVGPFNAVEFSLEYGIPLHPRYVHFYKALEANELQALIEESRKAEKAFKETKIVSAVFPNKENIKLLLEKICLPHRVSSKWIEIGEEFAYPFLKTMGAFTEGKIEEKEDVLETLTEISGLKIMDKCGTFIGTRMGRPEAAKPRKMVGNPHVLFPIGLAGGPTRSINKAMEKSGDGYTKGIKVEVALFKCNFCGKVLPQAYCNECNKPAEKAFRCPKCSKTASSTKCSSCGSETNAFSERNIDLDSIVGLSLENMKMKMPEIVKGVKGLINSEKTPEPIEKGILRAVYDLHIFRDATIRYEMLNAPLTHFKAREISTSVQKLRELGYAHDINGKPLEKEDQLLELFPQDIIVNENTIEFIYRTTKFVDDELEKFYGFAPFYKLKAKEEVIGQLVLGLAPHTSAAVIGRVIGYTQAMVCFAHPFYHLTKRRNADGDQDSIMLLMDALLNFSTHYLPSTTGARMDAPLVFTIALNPTEIDDEAYEIETCTAYPLELYEKSQDFVPPDFESIPKVALKLGKKDQYTGINFTHGTDDFAEGPKVSNYVRLKTMEEKINRQAKLQGKIRAVEKKDALERVLVSHFLPDIIGNARAFSRQNFRCTNCNAKHRRIPLNGKCSKCGKESIILTIAHGSVIKYLKIAKEITNSYNLSNYLKQRIDLIEKEVSSIFTDKKTGQKSLSEFA